MEGVTINNVDISEYGAILLAGAYAQLLTPLEPKEWVSNESPHKNGTDYIVPEQNIFKERSISLSFGVKGDNKQDFLAKYTSFISAIQNGIISLYIEELGRTYYLKYESCTSYDNFGLTACNIAVKFTEPNPTNNI